MNGAFEDKDNNFGVTSANDVIKLANINNKSGIEIPTLPTISCLAPQLSRSKIQKRFVIHLIQFCLKSGITQNKNIVQFLKENKVVLKGRTFDRYKSLAEKELENDLDADIWLSEKVQNGLVHDYKDICDRYDRQLVLDDMLMDGLIKQASDKALQLDQDSDKYYKYLDINEMMKIQTISNFTMKNKSEFISKGFIIYKIKQHIDCLHDQQRQKNKFQNNREIRLNFDSLRQQQPLSNSNSTTPSVSGSRNNMEVTGNVGDDRFEPAQHIKDIEKLLGKRVSSLERRIEDP